MHDLDRVTMQRETEFEAEGFPSRGPAGFRGELGEAEGGSRFEGASPLQEFEVAEIGAELLTVSNSRELEAFLGDVVSRAANAVRGAIDSPTGQAVVNVLKPIARAAIPAATGALGGAIGGAISDGVGAPIGAAVGKAAGDQVVQALGLELEGLSHEDRELEVAKHVVRLAAATAANAVGAPPHMPPQAVAQKALAEAARQLTSGLVAGPMEHHPHHHQQRHHHGQGAPMFGAEAGGCAQSGRWYRRGNKIILIGV
ncbi:MAG TPA: hypothetical protein VK841_24410 [Polyangiaceae bacterium]|nr:hypothetical protein [Polyangiaceae bacterium]